jgi:ferric-dicitrate binding protein FerR (iron transport regulator)
MSRKHGSASISEAVHWFHRFRMKGPTALSPDESSEWARWAARKSHLSEFKRAEQLWEKLRHLTKVPRPTQQDLETDDYDPEQPITEWLARGRKKPSP